MPTMIVMHRKIPIGLYVNVGSCGRGVWIGGSFHACADCAQLTIRLLFVDLTIAIAKKSEEDQAYLEAIHRQRHGENS